MSASSGNLQERQTLKAPPGPEAETLGAEPSSLVLGGSQSVLIKLMTWPVKDALDRKKPQRKII